MGELNRIVTFIGHRYFFIAPADADGEDGAMKHGGAGRGRSGQRRTSLAINTVRFPSLAFAFATLPNHFIQGPR